ncbi:3-hydroxyacyl-CoA dehydrogenase [Thermocatellispora tengchongensis]|uniref:3-hydroxyacyl-CoA dehydrogenase n=1 Tax=Thermocatellispora tengchongensis TaxID=1073253 RepID=A0A840PE40_9ACTN|nr:3-hydroxyacyl-CoA dehydrogenase NAD-binding domain-containing protein [Thermocatellispora tengchongensis]MBB5137878.1 3-hydroxyacyl-CoA dehydrogenase [Thermocatellispora tengchongensis]
MRIALVGGGLMGAGWAAAFLAHGHRVVVTDTDPKAEPALRARLERAWPLLREVGDLATEADPDPDLLAFAPDIASAVTGADFVQESGPEDLGLKRSLFAEIDKAAPEGAVIASSSSGIPISEIQRGQARPERMVIGHPLNPPHLMPLVEVVGGEQTAEAAVTAAIQVYRSVGKRPLRLDRETPGHIVNRLQSALTREAVAIVLEGVGDARAVDDALTWGPGLRSALVGPLLNMHLAGGERGIEGFLAAFGTLTGDLPAGDPMARLIAGVHAEAAGRSIAEIEDERDRWVIRCRRLLAEFGR